MLPSPHRGSGSHAVRSTLQLGVAGDRPQRVPKVQACQAADIDSIALFAQPRLCPSVAAGLDDTSPAAPVPVVAIAIVALLVSVDVTIAAPEHPAPEEIERAVQATQVAPVEVPVRAGRAAELQSVARFGARHRAVSAELGGAHRVASISVQEVTVVAGLTHVERAVAAALRLCAPRDPRSCTSRRRPEAQRTRRCRAPARRRRTPRHPE